MVQTLHRFFCRHTSSLPPLENSHSKYKYGKNLDQLEIGTLQSARPYPHPEQILYIHLTL